MGPEWLWIVKTKGSQEDNFVCFFSFDLKLSRCWEKVYEEVLKEGR